MKLIQRLFLCLLVLIAGGIVAFNALFIPRGHHLARYLNAVEEHVYADNDRRAVEYITFKPLSEVIFKYTGNYCDAPYFLDKYTYTEGRNMTVQIMVVAHSDNIPVETKAVIYHELEEALRVCDPNVLGEGRPLLPLDSAILFGDGKVVSLLLSEGARLDTKIHLPGKKIDGMTPIDLAKALYGKEKDAQKKAKYKAIVSMLEARQGEAHPNLPHPDRPTAKPKPDFFILRNIMKRAE